MAETQRRRVGVRITASVRPGTGRDRIHALVVLTVEPPPGPAGDAFDAHRHVLIERVLRYNQSFESPGATCASWHGAIRGHLQQVVGKDPVSQHLHRDFDATSHRPFKDSTWFRQYHAALAAAAEAARPRAEGDEAAVVDDVHGDLFSALAGEAGHVDLTYEVEDLGLAPEEAAAAPAGAAPAAAAAVPRFAIPFFPMAGRGEAAVLLKPGDEITPERDRTRRWRVVAVTRDPDLPGSVLVRARLVGPLAVNEKEGMEGAIRIPTSIRIPLADESARTGEADQRFPPWAIVAVAAGTSLAVWLLLLLLGMA